MLYKTSPEREFNPDPLARVQALDNDVTLTGGAVSAFAAFLVHSVVIAFALLVPPDEVGIDAVLQTMIVDVVPEPAPAELPEIAPPPPAAAIPSDPPPLVKPLAPEPEQDPYEDLDATPAEASKVLTAKEEPSAPPAPPEQTFASGEGAGVGMVAGSGTGSGPTYNSRARVTNTVKGPLPEARTAKPSGPVGLSRAAGLHTMRMCQLPDELDVESAFAKVVVTVGTDGKALGVELVFDPGYGLGPVARSCAFTQMYTPGRDAEGRPIVTKTAPIQVRFMR